MNNFADTLLKMLFGWMRTLMEGVWNAFSSGRMRNTISWLGDHWLWLVVFLCIACTVLDYFIWFIRWKPYVIWRNKLRRLFQGRPAHDEEPEYYLFQQGYDDGVDMDLSDMPVPAPAAADAEYFAWQQPVYEPQPETLPLEPAGEMAEEAYVPQEMPVFIPEQPAVRNRRSQRHEKKKSRLHGILPVADEESEQQLDGLPPAVDKNDAFHAPVYPGQYNNQQG